MTRYSIAEARAHLPGLVDEAQQGPIEITRRGRPVLVVLSVGEYRRISGSPSFYQAVKEHRKQHAGALDRGASWLPRRSGGRERNAWT